MKTKYDTIWEEFDVVVNASNEELVDLQSLSEIQPSEVPRYMTAPIEVSRHSSVHQNKCDLQH